MASVLPAEVMKERVNTEIITWNVNEIKDAIPGLWKKLLKLAWKSIREYYEE